MLMPEPVFLAGDWEYAPWLGLDDGPRPVLEPSGAGGSLCEVWLGATEGAWEGGEVYAGRVVSKAILNPATWEQETGGF